MKRLLTFYFLLLFCLLIQHVPNCGPMPRNKDKMSDCEIEQLLVWIGKGALDN